MNVHPLEPELEVMAPYLCPELRLWLLPPGAKSWHATEPVWLDMPYWAFAWPGGQALARYLLDHPEVVRGRRVLDFGSGCALEGIAAAKGGAQVRCADIDPLAASFALRNAELNEVRLEVTTEDLIGSQPEVDLILAGDACYAPELAARLLPWLFEQARRGVRVLVGDPLRVPGALDAAEHVDPKSEPRSPRAESRGQVSVRPLVDSIVLDSARTERGAASHLGQPWERLATYAASFDGDPRGLTVWPTHVLKLPELQSG